jgi:mannose-6-phosphate isomerase-like protein (cupin superfamily)
MGDFPAFMKDPRDQIATSSQYTDDIEGWVFDGAGGSQVCFWRCATDRVSAEHTHDFDEWVVVLEGSVTAIMGDRRVELAKGDELLVPRGTKQSMAVAAGTRTMHVFGGPRARRAIPRRFAASGDEDRLEREEERADGERA